MTYPLVEVLQIKVQEWWSNQHEHPVEPWEDELSLYFKGTNLVPCGWGYCNWQQGRSPEALVASLRPHITGELIKAAQRLEEPGVAWSLAIASSLMPRPYGDELQFVVDIIEAAGAQSVQERNQALVGAGVAGASVVALLLIAWFNRE